jgi:phage shock protein A
MKVKVLNALGGWFKAKDRQTAEKIEESNIVEFAKNDLEHMEGDLKKVQENIGHVKARISQLNDEIKEIKDEITTNTGKASQLLDKGTPQAEGLAQQICASVEALQKKLEINQQALTQQEALLDQQQETKTTLEDHLQECKNELEIMKTQKAVTEGNETLVSVSAESSGSSVEKFKERRKALDAKLKFSTAMVEQTQDGAKSLSQKADDLLGKSKGSELFEKLRANKKPV